MEETPVVLPDHLLTSTVAVWAESVERSAVVATVTVVFGSESHSCLLSSVK